MAKYLMTWVPNGRRWRKVHKGRAFVVSCRQLGVPETKEASWKAANAWWESQQDIEGEDERLARASRIGRLVKDFAGMDEAGRREAVEALLGAGAFDKLVGQADTLLEGLSPPAPGRSVGEQAENWKRLLHASCRGGQMSEGRYDAYCRRIAPFVAWMGPGASIETIDEAKLEGYFGFLSEKLAGGEYAATTAHEMLMTAKQFLRRLAEMRLIPLPGNIDSRRFRFNHSAPAKIETFTNAEVRAMLAACDGHSERTKLYLLLCLNCGMYQNDIAELRQDEVDWRAGTITRARSKTRERGGPVVTYQLWPETFALLKAHRSPGELALATTEGNPLVKYWLDQGKLRRYDAVQSAYNRLAARMGLAKHRLGIKHLRKTSATLLGKHPAYKFYANHFLADSPKGMADRHYVVPSGEEFCAALAWLRQQYLEPQAQPLLDDQHEDEPG